MKSFHVFILHINHYNLFREYSIFMPLLVCGYFLLGITWILYRVFFHKTGTERRHAAKIEIAKKVITKLGTFEGEHRNAQMIAYLRKIDAYVFEELLLCAFENKGFKITRNKRYSGDGGIDGMVVNDQNQRFYIQAKRYNKSISSAHIHSFSKLVNVNKAFGGYFIHTGKTPVSTLTLYKQSNITIISGSKLVDLITTIPIIKPQTNYESSYS